MGGPAMVRPKPPIPIPDPSGLPPGSHLVPPCRVRVWAPTPKQSSASPARLSTAPHSCLQGGPRGSSHVGWGALQCRSRGDGVQAPCLACPGYVELPPLQPHGRVLHWGRSTSQSPPAWGFVPGPFPHPFPPSTPGTVSHPQPQHVQGQFSKWMFLFYCL